MLLLLQQLLLLRLILLLLLRLILLLLLLAILLLLLLMSNTPCHVLRLKLRGPSDLLGEIALRHRARARLHRLHVKAGGLEVTFLEGWGELDHNTRSRAAVDREFAGFWYI